MRFDDSYRQKIDQMHLDDAFIGNLADQMTEAATNREHIEVMEMDPGQPIQHRRKWISAAGTVAAAAAIVALTVNMTLPRNQTVPPMAPGSETSTESGSDSSQQTVMHNGSANTTPLYTGTAYALYQEMENQADPALYDRLESRINSWFYFDTEMPAGDPEQHTSFLEQIADPEMQTWLMQMMTGFDQQENAKILADEQEIAFLGYTYERFEARLRNALLGDDTQAVLLTPDQDFIELSRGCRKIAYLEDDGGTFCAMNGVASDAFPEIYYDVQEAAYTTAGDDIHWGVIVYEYLLTQEGQVLDAATGTVIGSYITNDSYFTKMGLAAGDYGSYESIYTFGMEQDTPRTAFLFELTSRDTKGSSFCLYNKYPLEEKNAALTTDSPIQQAGTQYFTDLDDFLYYYAQRAANMPMPEDFSRITAKDEAFLEWALQQVEAMQFQERSSVLAFSLDEIELYLQLTYNEAITLPRDADYAAIAEHAGVDYQNGRFSYSHPLLDIENGGTVLARNSMHVIELDDGAYLVQMDGYERRQNQCYSLIDGAETGGLELNHGMYIVKQNTQFGCDYTRQYLFRMQAVLESQAEADQQLPFSLPDTVLQDTDITSMQIVGREENEKYLSTAENCPFTDDGSAVNYPTTALMLDHEAVLSDGTLLPLDDMLIGEKTVVGITYRTAARHSVFLTVESEDVDCYLYRHTDGKLSAVTGTETDSGRKIELPAETGDYTLIAVDRTNGVTYLCLVSVI